MTYRSFFIIHRSLSVRQRDRKKGHTHYTTTLKNKKRFTDYIGTIVFETIQV